MYDIQLFSYGLNPVRIIKINNEVWFIAKDVCDVLELTNPTEALKALDDDEKNTLRISEGNQSRGNPNMNIISEAGLYKLIFRSNKPEAKEFTRWVTHEVLPQIREKDNRINNTQQITEGAVKAAQVVFETAGITGNQLALALDKIYYSYTGKSALQTGQVMLIAPTLHQLLTPTEIGKHFGLSAKRINQALIDYGFQEKTNAGYQPLELGERYAVMLDTNKRHTDGTPVRQLKWDYAIIEELEPVLA